MSEAPETQIARQNMVQNQLVRRGMRDERVIKAMRTVPRHLFLPDAVRSWAYDDSPAPIGQGQTISQPYMVALMVSYLDLRGDERVLEIGGGSGYQAAVLGQLAGEVHSIEMHPSLATKAAEVLRELGYANVHMHTGDGSNGLPAHAPYDGIIVAAAAPTVPEALKQQLAQGGRLVIPVGGEAGQDLLVYTRQGEDMDLMVSLPVAFVPLRGSQGWDEATWPVKPPRRSRHG